MKEQLAADAIIDESLATSRARTAKALAEAERAGASAGGGATPGFQVTGGVNLGQIDLQKEREATQNVLLQLKKDAEETLRATGQENMQLRDKIHESERKLLEITFTAQMENLKTMLEREKVPQKTFMDQYTEASEIAKVLGFNLAPGGNGSPEIALQIKKLEFDHALAIEDRKDAREESRKDWELRLRELDERAEDRKADLERQIQRDKVFFQAPEIIGAALAQGFIQKGAGAPAGVAAAPQAPGTKRAYHVDAAPGQSGTTPCPECQSPIGIGSTARSAACPGCGITVSIRRGSAPPAGQPPEAPPGEHPQAVEPPAAEAAAEPEEE